VAPDLNEAPPGRARLRRLPLNHDLSLYLIEDESVLFSSRSRRLFGLDRTATLLLLRLADGETIGSLITELGLDPSGEEEVAQLAALLAGRETSEEDSQAALCSEEVPCGRGSPPHYRLLTTVFSLECADEALRSGLSGELRHLRVPDQPDLHLAITVEPEGTLWLLRFNGTEQSSAIPASRILPLLYGRLRMYAYRHFPYLLAMHAAVVTDGRRTIVFPGKSGSGKSTMAASLLARGYRLISDELAVLDLEGNLVPMPLGLGVKGGSWPSLEKDYPSLRAMPVHVRWDGLQVRYLESAAIRYALDRDKWQATQICFHAFQPDGRGRIEQLSPVQALRAMSESGFQARILDPEHVERILSWLLELPCCALTYSSSGEALELLDGSFAA
jgi:hypothetical protein